MGKDQELLEAARKGNTAVVEKILGQRAKRSGPLARWVIISCQTMHFVIVFKSLSAFIINLLGGFVPWINGEKSPIGHS